MRGFQSMARLEPVPKTLGVTSIFLPLFALFAPLPESIPSFSMLDARCLMLDA